MPTDQFLPAGACATTDPRAGGHAPAAAGALLDDAAAAGLGEAAGLAAELAEAAAGLAAGEAGALGLAGSVGFAAVGGEVGATAVDERARAEFRDVLASVGMGLERRLKAPVGLLSGGQRQALTLLMASLAQPRILLLDEHTAALDPAAAAQIESLTVQLATEQRLTTLMVTHNMQQALRVGTRTIMLHQGEIALDVSEEERRGMTVDDLVRRFHDTRQQALVDDELLLTS
jgi:ABC-type uncharacterized transport system ATPase component